MRHRTVPPTVDEQQMVLAWMEQAYSGFPEVDENWDSRENFLSELKDLDYTSTPGWPYMRAAPTIGAWLGADLMGNLDPVKVEMLWHDVKKVMAGTYEHWFRVFVKDEPHKRAKIDQQRWRLIIAASLPVQVVWRMCFSRQNDWLNDNPYSIPSSHGLVFAHGGWRRFKAHCNATGLRYSRDISSWDINMPGWVVDAVKLFRTRVRAPESWRRVVQLLYDDAFLDSKLLFSKGVVLRQTYKGFMKSGLFNTITDNSLSMVIMHVLASYRSHQPVGSVWATGDDVLQSHMSDGYIKELERLGCKVKEWTRGLDFMGTDFETNPMPKYFSKHVVNIVSAKRDLLPEILDSYCRLYAYSPAFAFWEHCAKINGIKVRSRLFYQFWYSSPMSAYFSWS